MFEAWSALLQLLSQFVIPDWGSLISLLPIAIMALALLTFAIVFRRLIRAPKARRGFRPIAPSTPAGIHMPGPSFAPIFAAVGAFLSFLGVVFGGTILILGAIAFALTLFYWLAEAMRVYDHDISASAPPLHAVVHDGPPPGVHMPGPSYRPFLGALGTMMLMFGLVFGGWLLAVGVIALVVTLSGWLVDAVKEYRKTVEADQTGHMENIPAPRTPSLLIGTLAVLFIGSVLLQAGILPPRSAVAGAPGASGAPPAGSAAPPVGSAAPASDLPTGDVTVTASGIKYVETTFTAPTAKPFTIVFDNQDAGTPHDIDIRDSAGALVFDGKVIQGVSNIVYDVGALPAGTYPYVCSIHSDMTGTATIQ